MKNRRTQGFTLIELLIVIAIIGILAAVLIPNLLGARTSANKKAIQSHSSNVYKAATAVLADSPNLSVEAAATAIGTDCLAEKANITASGTVLKFGWSKAPGSVSACTVGINAAKDDFVVTVTGSGDLATQQSINGKDLSATPAAQ